MKEERGVGGSKRSKLEKGHFTWVGLVDISFFVSTRPSTDRLLAYISK